MRATLVFGTVLLSLTSASVAQATVLTGFAAQPAPAGVTSAVDVQVPSFGAQTNNEEYTGGANPNTATLSFSYNDTYRASPSLITWRTGTQNNAGQTGAKEFTITVNVTNNSSRALEELSFFVTAPSGNPNLMDFDAANGLPVPTSPLNTGAVGLARPAPNILKFGFLGNAMTIAAGGGTGAFVFSLDVPDGLNGVTYSLSAQVTPEPASMGLAMVATVIGGGIGIRRRRRAKQTSSQSNPA